MKSFKKIILKPLKAIFRAIVKKVPMDWGSDADMM